MASPSQVPRDTAAIPSNCSPEPHSPITTLKTGLVESTLSNLSASDAGPPSNIPRDFASPSTVPQVGLITNSPVSRIPASPPISEDLALNDVFVTFKILDTLGKFRDSSGRTADRLPLAATDLTTDRKLGLVDMTPSNPPALGLTAHAPPTPTPSHPAGPSHIPGVGSMQSVIDDLARLATTISQDRDIHVYSKDVLLDAHVVGAGFVNDAKGSEETDMDEMAHIDVEPSLFAGGENSGDVIMNGDSEYIDEGVEEQEDLDQNDAEETSCEEVVNWLNSLGDQIVSYFSKDAVHSFPTSLLT
jgi:superfamily II DNA or RNA helicase